MRVKINELSESDIATVNAINLNQFPQFSNSQYTSISNQQNQLIQIAVIDEIVMIFFLARVHETWMKESFSTIDRYLLCEQCNCTKHFQMHLIDSVERFVL